MITPDEQAALLHDVDPTGEKLSVVLDMLIQKFANEDEAGDLLEFRERQPRWEPE